MSQSAQYDLGYHGVKRILVLTGQADARRVVRPHVSVRVAWHFATHPNLKPLGNFNSEIWGSVYWLSEGRIKANSKKIIRSYQQQRKLKTFF